MNEPKRPGPGGGPGGPPPKAGYTENHPETDWILTESTAYPNGIYLYDGHLPAAPEGKAILMTVAGVPTTIAPGAYPGKVELIVYTLTHVPDSQAELSTGDFRAAVHVKNGMLQSTALEHLAGPMEETPDGLRNLALTTDLDDFNGVIVDADESSDSTYTIRDSRFHCRGGGNSEGRGAGLMTVGTAHVKLDGAEFWNYGTQSAIIASGHSHLEVANSVIYGARDFSAGKLCPWVLGINGANRLTNAIDYAQVDYHDSIVVAQSWAALSTDSGKGVRLTGERLFSGIGRLEPYQEDHAADYTAVPELRGKKYGFYLGNSAIGECGYVNYADAGFHNSFRDVTFYSPDYIFILSTKQASIDVEGDSFCHSGRIGVLWHKNSGGTVSLKGGKWYAEDTLFQTKSYSATDTIGCYCHTVCDGTDITLGKGGVLYQLMTSDDVGLMGPSTFTVPEIEWKLDTVEKLPETYPAQKMFAVNPILKYPIYLVDGQEVPVKGDVTAFLAEHPQAEKVMYDAPYRIQPATFTLKNLNTAGDIFNGVYQRIQVLDVNLEHASVQGTISSAHTYHVDKQGNQVPAGTSYSKFGREDEHLGIGRMGNTPAPAINNPVHLTLRNGAIWTPTGDSYLEQLDLDESSRVEGRILVDGAEVSGPGRYTGSILVRPTAK